MGKTCAGVSDSDSERPRAACVRGGCRVSEGEWVDDQVTDEGSVRDGDWRIPARQDQGQHQQSTSMKNTGLHRCSDRAREIRQTSVRFFPYVWFQDKRAKFFLPGPEQSTTTGNEVWSRVRQVDGEREWRIWFEVRDPPDRDRNRS